MSLRLQELQDKNKYAYKLRIEQLIKDDLQDIDGILHYQGLFYILEII